jgi:hypothetical protein
LENQFNTLIGDLNPYAYPVYVSGQGKFLLSQLMNKESIAYQPCEMDYFTTTYLNRADVKLAIHARTDLKWAACSSTTNFDHLKNSLRQAEYVLMYPISLILSYGKESYEVLIEGLGPGVVPVRPYLRKRTCI